MLRTIALGTTLVLGLLAGGATAYAGGPHGHGHGGGRGGGPSYGHGHHNHYPSGGYYPRPYPVYRPAPVYVAPYPAYPTYYAPQPYYQPAYVAPRSGFGIRTDDFSLWLGR